MLYLSFAPGHQFQDFNEKVDDVQVKLNCSQNVFFGGHSSHDHLSVKNNEAC